MNKKIRVTKLTALLALAMMAFIGQMCAQQTVQKPLVLIYTATFAPKAGEGPSIQHELQADSFLGANKLAMAWGQEYCPQNVLVSLAPKSVGPQEILTATFAPKVGDGPSLQFEFTVGTGPSVASGFQVDSFLRAIRMALSWGKEFCPQNVLVSLVPSQGPQGINGPQEPLIPIAGGTTVDPIAPAASVFTARFISRDSGLVIQQEVKAQSFDRAARTTLAWSKVHSPNYLLLSLVQNNGAQ